MIDEPTIKYSVLIPKSQHKVLKQASLDYEVSMQTLVRRAIDHVLEELKNPGGPFAESQQEKTGSIGEDNSGKSALVIGGLKAEGLNPEDLRIITGVAKMLTEKDRRSETIRIQVDHWAFDKEQEQAEGKKRPAKAKKKKAG